MWYKLVVVRQLVSRYETARMARKVTITRITLFLCVILVVYFD